MSWYLMVERSELEHQTARGWQGANAGSVRLAPRVVRLDNADTGEIREWRPMTAAGTATGGLDSLIEAYDEYGGLCGKIARELGPEIARRWEDGDESLDLAAEVAALYEARESAAAVLTTVAEDRDHCHATIREWVRVQEAEGDGVRHIGDERRRQVESEGWTPEHDDAHRAGELALAAACYALPAAERERQAPTQAAMLFELLWPWTLDDWRPAPADRIRELTRAGAMIAAEIDRLTRERGLPS